MPVFCIGSSTYSGQVLYICLPICFLEILTAKKLVDMHQLQGHPVSLQARCVTAGHGSGLYGCTIRITTTVQSCWLAIVTIVHLCTATDNLWFYFLHVRPQFGMPILLAVSLLCSAHLSQEPGPMTLGIDMAQDMTELEFLHNELAGRWMLQHFKAASTGFVQQFSGRRWW